MLSRDVVGVAEDLALGLMWNKNAWERDKTIVYDLSAKLGKFCHYHAPSLFRTSRFQVEHPSPLITLSQTSIVSDIVSGTGYSPFRTDTVYSGRILFIPNG